MKTYTSTDNYNTLLETMTINSSNHQLILDNIPDIAWYIDKSGIFQMVNQAFLKLYSCKAEDVIGKTYNDLLDSDTAERYIKEDLDVINKNEKKVLECNVNVDSDGWVETQWLETILIPAHAPEDPDLCIGVIGIGRDITERKQAAFDLKEQQDRLKIYFDLPLIGMAVINEDMLWQDINKKFCHILGYSNDELLQINFNDVIIDNYKDQLNTSFKALANQAIDSIDLELEMQHQNGHTIFTHLIARCPLPPKDQKPYFVIMLDDISQRKQAEHKLHLANKVIECSSEAILITDDKNKIVRVNSAFSQLTGYEEGEVLGKDPKLLRSGRHTHEFYQQMWESMEEVGHWQGEIWDRRKDGSIYPKWMNISAITQEGNGSPNNYVALFSDITKQKKAENQIKYMVYHDTLTGLPNRALLEQRLNQAISSAEIEGTQIAIMQIDLDNFKTINDSMGHYMGDQLLKEVSERLKNNFRNTDLIARIGGDEFVIMLDKLTSLESVEVLAGNIIKLFKEQFYVVNYSMHITPSIGICSYPKDGENYEILLQNSDTAMFHSKKEGRNQYSFFISEMSYMAQQRLKLEYRMRVAIEKQDFIVFYQPQIDLKHHKVIGVEALVRWPYGDTMISPVEFIPVAEDTGLIRPLGEWILNQSCIDCKSWHDQGYHINVAVNLAAQQFEMGYLTSLVIKTLDDSGLDARYLDLEITEGTLMNNSKNAISILNSLKEMGIKLSIDDFGTGYSSLAYLKAFNIDKLKIDRSFVTGLPTDKDDVAIATAIIQMAKSLDLKIVAEGAETIEHIDFLKEKECDQIQGFYFAKPMPSDELMVFLKNWS